MSAVRGLMMTIGGEKKIETPSITDIPIADVSDTSFSFTVSSYVGPGVASKLKIVVTRDTDPNFTTPIYNQEVNISSDNKYNITGLTTMTAYLVKVSYLNSKGVYTSESTVKQIVTLFGIPDNVTVAQLVSSWGGDDATNNHADVDTYGYLYKSDKTAYSTSVVKFGSGSAVTGIRLLAGDGVNNTTNINTTVDDDQGKDLNTTNHTYHSELLSLTLASIPTEITYIVLVANLSVRTSHSSMTTLNKVVDFKFRLLDASTSTKVQLADFNMTEATTTTHALMVLYRSGTKWKGRLINKATSISSDIVKTLI